MTRLSGMLDDAESLPTEYRIVEKVCINKKVARERLGFQQALAAAEKADAATSTDDQRLGAAPAVTDEQTKAAQAELDAFDASHPAAFADLKFSRMDGVEWQLLCSEHPFRPNAPLDISRGYNVDDVSLEAAARTARLISDDGEEEIPREEWDRMLKVIGAFDVSRIVDAVWSLNQFENERLVENAVFGSGAA